MAHPETAPQIASDDDDWEALFTEQERHEANTTQLVHEAFVGLQTFIDKYERLSPDERIRATQGNPETIKMARSLMVFEKPLSG